MRKFALFPILLIAALACTLPGLPSSRSAPESVVGLETAIVQTADAAQTQTVVAQPPTLTPTVTREPTATLIVQPATPTPFSLLALTVAVETLHPDFDVTQAASGLGPGPDGERIPYTGEPWTCAVRAVFPPRGWQVKPDQEFTVTWTILNTGTKFWTVNTIDFVYHNGYRHEGRAIQDLWRNVASGTTVNLKVEYKSPKAPGEYYSRWNLRVGNRDFCVMQMSFEVVR